MSLMNQKNQKILNHMTSSDEEGPHMHPCVDINHVPVVKLSSVYYEKSLTPLHICGTTEGQNRNTSIKRLFRYDLRGRLVIVCEIERDMSRCVVRV